MNREYALVVDDSDFNRDILVSMLEDDYQIIEAKDGNEAIARIREYEKQIAVMLLDLVMPNKDGIAVLNEMLNSGWHNQFPVLVISAETSPEIERQCFELGVVDFVHKPFDALLVKRRTQNAARLSLLNQHLEARVNEQTQELSVQNEKLERLNGQIIDLLATVVEARNMESGMHVKRVKGFTRIVAKQMMTDWPEYGLTPESVELIASASALHDVGKILIPDSILMKPGKLTPDEYEFMKTHTVKGCEMLSFVPEDWDETLKEYAVEICRHHHEKWDGNGYPDKLAGDDIPISAQITALADVYDALTADRVYRKALSPETAHTMILNGECGLFNPKVIESFEHCKDQMADFTLKNKS